VMNGSGTWIDWQYLFNAAALLAKCRYTLQYTYPYAYYMEAGSRKNLFEYQQVGLVVFMCCKVTLLKCYFLAGATGG